MGVSTGEAYKRRLRDDRTVYYKGDRIEDVTTHPATRELIDTHADLFDLQHDPEYEDRLTYESPLSGERVSVFYRRPETVDDLVARREATRCWHERTGGYAARLNDFLATGLMALAVSHEVFDADGHRRGDNVVRYYEYCRENDLCLTHALIDPQIDRSKGSSFRAEDDVERPGALRKVGETEDGIVVSGARMLATLGPQADELLLFPFGHYGEDEADEALAFAVPVEADGLRLICRPSLSPNDARNHPLASRLDEMDAFVVLDEVVVPDERVFVDGDVDVANAWRETAQPAFASHQTVTKDLVKAEFVFGVAVMLAESTGIDEYFHVQSKLGEIAEAANLLNAAVLAAERQATTYRDTDYLVPDYATLNAALSNFADRYQRFVQILKDLGGSGLVGVPAWEDLEADSPLGGDVATYFRGKDVDARERLGVQKLAFDIALSGFGGREELYERFHVGGPMRVKANQYKGYPNTEEIKARVRRFGLDGADGRGGQSDAPGSQGDAPGGQDDAPDSRGDADRE